ncbi:bile acid:sodium symporter [Pseudonocardia kujensis]|uniref:bile acid:sodium symporter family protein n=1 Tax=Pseudonocardia kujensis TaxID=1128675 RepID=UPI001E507C71|nr:bile acid:sodium symporter [Pseudonocardia kujensis]MCE0764413.1 bile acid:sodium symporter [Pseudonocardia kujensis]
MPSNELLTVINSFGLLFAILNSFTLGLRLPIFRILEHFFQNWRLATRVLLINFVVLPALVIGFATIAPINPDIKIGFCIVALAAGAPFAPAITRLARGDVAMSTALLLVMVLATVIVVSLVLPLAVSAVVPGVGHVRIWDVAWPLLAFLVAPLLIGCVMRLRYEEAVSSWVSPLLIIQIVCLVLYVNLFIFAFTSLFRDVWWGAYVAAIAVPVLGIALGSVISIRGAATRHASIITTAQRSITGGIIVTVFNYTQPLANVSVTVINTIGIVILVILAFEWRRTRSRHEPEPDAAGAPPAPEGSGRSS